MAMAQDVSIHARTRRATYRLADTQPLETSFNPRPHAAGDNQRRPRVAMRPDSFNPRPHAAGDVPSIRHPATETSFNPRPHAAGDERAVNGPYPTVRFQSTPARGGRHDRIAVYHQTDDVSIHARTRRATCLP